jgi:hypothetical protein
MGYLTRGDRQAGSTNATITIAGQAVECSKSLGPTGTWTCVGPDGQLYEARTLVGLEHLLKKKMRGGMAKKTGGGGGGKAGNQPQRTGRDPTPREPVREKPRQQQTRQEKAEGVGEVRYDRPNRYQETQSTGSVGRFQPAGELPVGRWTPQASGQADDTDDGE